jgi:hypothetical protein
VKIDLEKFELYCEAGCTPAEVAAVLGVREVSLRRHFEREMEQLRLRGLAKIRLAQFNRAMGGNVIMQIWLGKQLLGQRDYVRNEQSGTLVHNFQRMDDEARLERIQKIIETARMRMIAGPDERSMLSEVGQGVIDVESVDGKLRAIGTSDGPDWGDGAGDE